METTKICIIKLGALGDVVRTLSVLPAIKEKFPDSEITWVTKENALELFENNFYVNRVFSIPVKPGVLGDFDILYNFDIEKDATELANEISAEKKFGFYSEGDYSLAFSEDAEYYLNTMFDDELKKKNQKTYQEMMFALADLEWKKQLPEIFLENKHKEYSEEFIEKNKLIGKKIIGIHFGAGSRWPSKVWHDENLKEFISKAKTKNYEIILFAGENEKEKQQEIISDLKNKRIEIYSNNPNNSIKEFASLVDICDKFICGDSFSLHVATALEKPTVALFFCTSPSEIEEYGSVKKIISPKLKDFFPEKSDLYDEELVKSISSEEVLRVIEELEEND